MIKAFLNWLDRIGRKRIIMDRADNEPYLERYYVFLKERRKFPFNVFIHKFLKWCLENCEDVIQAKQDLAC